MAKKEKIVEARKWFRGNENPFAFASNVFGETKEAKEFVKSLYKFGVKKVEVTGILEEPFRIKDEGGPYADTLIVHVPSRKREDFLLKFSVGGSYLPDELSRIKPGVYRLWWD